MTRIAYFFTSPPLFFSNITHFDANKCPLRAKARLSGTFLGIDYALLPNLQWNKKQKHKKQPWSKVECFAFGVVIVRFAALETSFHAANTQSLRHPLRGPSTLPQG